MVGAVFLLGLVMCGLISFLTLGCAAQDWARAFHAKRHRG